MIHEGGSTAEASSTSTVATDLVTISGLSIAPTRPIMLTVSFRKTTAGGSLLRAGAGLAINGTVVSDAVATNPTANLGAFSDGNTSGSTSESGFTQVWCGPRVTDYRAVPLGQIITSTPTGNQIASTLLFVAENAAWPTSTITSIAIRGKTESLSATIYVNQVHIYSIAVS